MSDFPAMNWHELTESHRYWVRKVMRARTPHPISRNAGSGPIDRTFIKNYIAFVEAICGPTEGIKRGRSYVQHNS
jgi:hypothetical protein